MTLPFEPPSPPVIAPADDRTWWESLQHFGLLLGPRQVAELDQRPLRPLAPFNRDQLRQQLVRFDAGQLEAGALVSWVFEAVLGFRAPDTGDWLRRAAVSSAWTQTLVSGEAAKPRHVWTTRHGFALPVFFDTRNARLGMHRGRKEVSDVLQWLRAAGRPLALLTNGRQWRLLYAGLDHQAACQGDVDQWFEAGEPGLQLEALRRLLNPVLLTPPDAEAEPPLVELIRAARRGQAQEISSVLGERVREAVEDLLRAHGPALAGSELAAHKQEVYRAAVRIVMRLVVALFAESRDLLPRTDPLYGASYGLTALFERLHRERPGARRRRHAAWPRLLALFRLIHDGSHHQALPVPAYGGELFAAGSAASDDPIRRAVHLFETACFETRHELVSDETVHKILERLTRMRIRVRQGRASTWTTVPVDFSDLSSEYIGILYEGLLDYELRAAPEGDPVVFLAVGNQPALPLSRLEAMNEKAVKELFDKLEDTSGSGDDEEEDEEPADEPEEDDDGDEPEVSDEDDQPEEEEEEQEEEEDDDDDGGLPAREQARARAHEWTRRACEIAGLVARPRGRLTPERREQWQRQIDAKARRLASRVVLPGEWYLVRWGGTRKGSGTFYTRPQLAVPLVHRTLRPLAYDPPKADDGSPRLDAPAADWTPRRPEEILALRVCDPACGSGTFPLAALRFLTDALYASLHHHGRLNARDDQTLVRLLGDRSDDPAERLGDERIPCRPDADDFEQRLKARLRRHVVERCLYAVDLDPLAVELCKLALWIETLDRDLPFSFLDHKVRCGNALVGAWFDTFQHYPVMAWKREAGDSGHSNGVHFEKGELTRAIKTRCGNTNISDPDTVRADLAAFLEGPTLFEPDRQAEALTAHDDARAALELLHELPVHEAAERARVWREEVVRNPALTRLHQAFDLWCALWFWPADEIEAAPLPSAFAHPSEEARRITARVAAGQRFFHWELEFPDVFREEGAGFDAVIGNPPWDIAKPNSKEFFSNVDPLYRSYGKQQALRKQAEYFQAEPSVEDDWLDYLADLKAQSNFVRSASSPCGDPALEDRGFDKFSIARGKTGAALHDRWRAERRRTPGYADPGHPFRHQGSADINLYKLFLEQGHALLASSGRLGLLVPSGLYSDHGTRALRELFLERCRWEWLFGFENRAKIFDIDSRFKFNPVIVQKGGETEAVRTAFMRRRLEDWEEAEEHATPYTRERVLRFSPKSKAILEIQSARDLEILETIYANSVLLGDQGPDGWGIQYAQGDFNMTSDSKLFPPRPEWEKKGYRPDEYSRWLQGTWRERTAGCPAPPGCKRVEVPEGVLLSRDGEAWIREGEVGDVALPLYEGRMIGQFDFSQKGWVSGKGRGAVWRAINWTDKRLDPQFLMSLQVFRREVDLDVTVKTVLMDVTSSSNTRTLIGTPAPNLPCGHKTPTLRPEGDRPQDILSLSGYLNSFGLDFCLRMKLGGNSVIWSVLEELPLPKALIEQQLAVARLVARLSLASWLLAPASLLLLRRESMPSWTWAVELAERLRLRVQLDALLFATAGLTGDDVAWVLRDADMARPRASQLASKGFWRVDKDKPPELRHTVLTLVAFHDLLATIRDHGGDRDAGIAAWLAQNDGEGWMLPETLRLADFRLGHDDRADRPQPVASALGPRFYDWQLEQDPEESWAECELHARNLLGADGFRKLKAEIEGAEYPPHTQAPVSQVAEAPEEPSGQRRLFPSERTLFDEEDGLADPEP